jgi:glucose/arabinose dehydrogenase
MKNKAILLIIFFILTAGAAGLLFENEIISALFSPKNNTTSQGVSASPAAAAATGQNQEIKTEVVADNLDIPWEIVFLPSGDMLVAQRPGTILKISRETKIIGEIEGVEHTGEGGLLGLVLHPDFEQNQSLYLYLTGRDNGQLINRVEKYKLENDRLSDRQVILQGIKGASYHDGGRIAFGPDNKLYITTGDAGQEASAQDTSSLNGKILRVNDDGSVPDDNPFDNEVYSYGHRNPQGLAWDNQGQLWAAEHGPSGLQSGQDEINLIKAGQNYGWPIIRGDQTQDGLVAPIIQSGTDETWAPAGLIYHNSSLFFAGLRGQSLYQAPIQDNNKINQVIAHFNQEFGRLRPVVLGPDGFIYMATSNRDGRGNPQPDDDKIIKVDLKIFN